MPEDLVARATDMLIVAALFTAKALLALGALPPLAA